MPVTKNDVERLQPNTIIWDAGRGSVAGFGVRRQRVAQIFVLKYTIHGRSRWFSIGRYGAPWTVEMARLEAKRLLGIIAGGEDPAHQRDKKHPMDGPITISQLCDGYLEAAQAGAILTRFNRPKKKSTLDIDVGRIERHIKPLIGNIPVVEADAKIIKRMIHDITVGKTRADIKTVQRGRAIVTGGPGTAARVADLLSGIMTWAVDEGVLTNNPVHKVRRYRGQPRQRFLTESEMAQLGEVLRPEYKFEGREFHCYAILIVKLLALTGCRLNEIASLKWSEVDLELSCLRLEDSKTGQSLRPIGASAKEILHLHSRLAGSAWVFPASRGEKSYQGTKREAVRIFKAIGFEDVTCHTLRHTFASYASGMSFSDGTIGGLLGHKGRGVTSRYIHRPDNALLSAANEVSNYIGQLLNGNGVLNNCI